MKDPTLLRSFWARCLQRPFLAGGLVVLLGALGVLLYASRGPNDAAASYFEVRQGDFLISVVEGGTIEAVNDVTVRSEFEGTARIIYIVKEGAYVKKDDILVELDSAQAQDQVNQQQITYEKNQFAVTQAEQQLTIQKSMVDGEVQAADLKLKFAQIELDKFLRGSRDLDRRNKEIEITNVVENLKIAEDRLEWTRRLHAKGWETKTKLDQDELSVSQLRLKKEQAEKALWLLMEFDEKKSLERLQADVQEAAENLERVKLQGERRLAQYEADLATQRSTLELSARKLERDRKQLEACRIKAPQDGLVVYAGGGGGGSRGFSSESMIEEGATVRNRQEIIKLPDTSSMKLELKIHEAHINNIRVGQQAFVVLDSMPDRRFQGLVSRVGVVPDTQSRWGNPNLKLYATQVLITDSLPNVKPGVSARAEIVITNLTGVVTVPIHAVTTRKGRQVVFTPGDPPVATPVSVGMYNTKFIEITSGLKPGDRVLLSPPFDTDEKDLGGAILAKGELPPPAPTNGLPVSLSNGEARPAVAGLAANGVNPGAGRMGAEAGAGPGGGPGRAGGMRSLPPEVLKEFDTDGNGELDETERTAMMTAMRERFGGQLGGAGGGPGRPGGMRAPSPEMIKEFDKNGDGELDETEREAMRTALRERFANQGGGAGGGPGRQGGSRAPSPEMIKEFDKNGDGELDETEREAMRTALRERSGGRGGDGGRVNEGGGRRGGDSGNAPADGIAREPRP